MLYSKRWLCFLLTLICWLLCSLQTLALDPSRRLYDYGIDIFQDGLPQQAVLSIAQTSDGYLWFGTYEGLARFNGVNFTVFDRYNTPQIQNNAIWTLLTTSDGTLWIGTLGGGLVSYLNGKFSVLTKQDGLPSDIVYAVIAAPDGTLWIGTQGGVAARTPDGKLQTYTYISTVRSLCLDRSGTLWIGTEGSGVMHLRDGKLTRFAADRLGTTIYSILETQDGTVWLADYGRGLVAWKNGQLRHYGLEHGLPDRLVWALYEDSHKELWVGFDGGGCARVRQGRFEVFSVRHGLSQGFVRSMCEDHEGSFWLGTSGGITRLRDTKVTVFGSSQGLSYDAVRSICATEDGVLWFGTDGGGVTALKPDGTTEVFNVANGRLPHDFVRSVYPSRRGGVWVGTNGGGLALVTTRTTTVYDTRRGLANNNVYALAEDDTGTLWIGTYGSGLNRLLPDGSLKAYTVADGLSQNTIRCLIPDGEGGVWIGTNGGGLNRLRRDGTWQVWKRENGLASDVVLALYQKDGELWIGTDMGLNRLYNGVLKTITAQDGLFDDKIFQILSDTENRFWMSCNRGIFCVPLRELQELLEGSRKRVTSVVYGKAEGMKTPQCNGASWPAGWATPNSLWFPTNKGAVSVEPHRIFSNPVPPPVHIERVRLEEQWIELNSSPEFVRNSGAFEVYYAALSYRVPEYVKFRYMLEGYDKQWIEANTRREIFYTNLPAGRYVFRVQASNDDGVWNQVGASFTFRLLPPLWQRWWAVTGYLLVGVCIVYGSVHLYLRSLKEHAARLERIVAERTREIANQRDELEMQRAQVLESIYYAERIQNSMLAYREQIAQVMGEVFILFQPKDIVSGDFFWFERVGSVVVAAIADCTGHGVPGALLSMVGSVLFTQIVKDGALTDPATVLERLDETLRLTLRRYATSVDIDDGMEIALCSIDQKNGVVTFAGAHRPLYYATNDGLVDEIKGTKRAIGWRKNMNPEPFLNHTLPITDGLTLYLSSDGFADQADAQGKRYGNKRFKQLLESLYQKDLEQQRLDLLKALTEHRGNETQRDDITVVGIRLRRSIS